ncbi:Short-chain dehydrogenase/reductase [Candidatus Protochlamydia naegleriophila]|uniref:Short-chain dehydrogenase/reductase n=1 Tax=Candidatus Protochlamydia naegleriophila TaxID=389348 RepID=A0A0U5JBU9_9BACT|nr:hypothetical protein [Candidatus Protochlamydia naegleriophila]CUI16894.1 Short-chain dehydrogenase/reductase [Candidatus Protochlamydia naegleriophila]
MKTPIDLLIHDAGDMPLSFTITKEGFEHMFAFQVLGPFILTKTLADLGKLRQGCHIIFVSSGGMYLQKLDLSELLFEKRSYNKYTGYANVKRVQVIFSELFSKNIRNTYSALCIPAGQIRLAFVISCRSLKIIK